MQLISVSVNEDNAFNVGNLPSGLPDSYKELITEKNGGYTPDKYFHFFGKTGPVHHNVILWNKEKWREWYSLDAYWFIFAEDIFGCQYFIKRKGRIGSVYMLDCTSGNTYFMADSYDSFIVDVVEDRGEEVIGDSKKLAMKYFEITKQKWEPFVHLSYKIPVILGGSERDINNIELCESSVNLTILGQLINQTKKLKPGTIITDVQIDYENREVKLIY